jgi:hypothetical protein
MAAVILIGVALGAGIIGILGGCLLFNIYQKIQKRRIIFLIKEVNSVLTEPIEKTFRAKPNYLTVENEKQPPNLDTPLGQKVGDPKDRLIPEGKKQYFKSDFVQELETNLAIATAPWSDKLLRFPTSSWDSLQGEAEPVIAKQYQELTQLYIDIRLANDIVWLSTEIGHRTSELDDSYIKLCTIIAGRLKGIFIPTQNTVFGAVA